MKTLILIALLGGMTGCATTAPQSADAQIIEAAGDYFASCKADNTQAACSLENYGKATDALFEAIKRQSARRTYSVPRSSGSNTSTHTHKDTADPVYQIMCRDSWIHC